MTTGSLAQFLATVNDRNPGQPEFMQAVTEVMESLWPFIEKHPKYAEQALQTELRNRRNLPTDLAQADSAGPGWRTWAWCRRCASRSRMRSRWWSPSTTTTSTSFLPCRPAPSATSSKSRHAS